MTEKPSAPPLDPVQQAFRIQQLEHAQELQQANTKQAIDNLGHNIDNVQIDVREIKARLTDIATAQQASAVGREEIARLTAAIDQLSMKMDSNYREHIKDTTAWQDAHENDNERHREEIQKDFRSIRDKTIWATGASYGISLLIGVVGGLVWNHVNDRFNGQAESIRELRADYGQYRDLTERRYDERVRKIHNIELYLVRGGERRDDPYNADPERK